MPTILHLLLSHHQKLELVVDLSGAYCIYHNIMSQCYFTIIIVVVLHYSGKEMKYRSRTDIISQILDTANGGGATMTKILYKACLSYNELKEYLTVLTQSDLLIYDVQTHTFMTTEKGLQFLKNLQSDLHLMGAYEFGYGSDEDSLQPFLNYLS
jgi:predicted transcriptional regulator